MNTYTGTTRVVQENYRKTTEVVRPCDEDERGAHSEKNARCGHTGEKKKRKANLMWKYACERDTTETGLEEDNATNRAAWRKKLISQTGDPRRRDKPWMKKMNKIKITHLTRSFLSSTTGTTSSSTVTCSGDGDRRSPHSHSSPSVSPLDSLSHRRRMSGGAGCHTPFSPL